MADCFTSPSFFRQHWVWAWARGCFWVLTLAAFCSSFFIYLPGPTLPLASLGGPGAALLPGGLAPAPNTLLNPAETVLLAPPYHLAEWPHTIGNWGWGLGLLLTPFVSILAISWLVRGAGTALGYVRFGRHPGRGRSSRWLRLAVALVAGFWLGGYVQQWSYGYSIRQAQPLLLALGRYKQTYGVFPDSLAQLMPRYLASIPTPGTLGATYFQYRTGPLLSFSYPHAAGLFPDYQLEYVPGPFQETNETRVAEWPDWQIRFVR